MPEPLVSLSWPVPWALCSPRPILTLTGLTALLSASTVLAGGFGGGTTHLTGGTPAAAAVRVADELLATGTAHHSYIGIQPATLTPEIARLLGISRTDGVIVLDVVKPGPAADAGIQPGDVITAINGKNTPSAEEFIAALNNTKPGDRVELTVQRGNATQKIEVVVADRPAA